jgi:hypothetical protein
MTDRPFVLPVLRTVISQPRCCLQPIFLRQDTSDSFQWRVRNMPYPLDTYSVTAEDVNLVLRTSNKKLTLLVLFLVDSVLFLERILLLC